jgi:prepilin-type N-terminal cleavage/methylation domain-containing protein
MRRAFTLVEILIVVVVIGILAAIVVPNFASGKSDAQYAMAKAFEDSLSMARRCTRRTMAGTRRRASITL